MKKALALLLCVLSLCFCILPCFEASAVGVSIHAGKDALVSQWGKSQGYGFDYRYYSPKKSQDDNTKYPLVVLLHGKYSGTKEGEQLTASDFFYWSSAEYQSRFTGSGGAYILMPRTPGGDGNTWANTSFHSDLKKLIDSFISDNSANIDLSRIYLGGWSMGGAGVISMASSYKNFFAALIVMAPFDAVTQSQLNAIKNTPTWLVTCTKDTTASHITFAKPFWNGLRDTTNIPSYCRMTTFEKYNYYDGGHHAVQHAVAADQLDQPSDCGMKTVNAKGERINTNEEQSIITWLAEQRLGEAKEDNVCKCECHSAKGWTKFVWSIKKFFYMLFSPSKKMCQCGQAHW